MKALPEIVRIKEKVESELLGRPGVNAVDVGYKYVDGKITDQIAIRVHVAKKKKSVPKDEEIPKEIEGVPTDVVERTYEAHVSKKPVEEVDAEVDATKYTTLKGGISLGPCRAVGGYVYVGTLGTVVKDNATGQPLMLSNFHVMCIDNGWHAGDTMAQPGRVDNGVCPTDVAGSLQRATLTGTVDAAVASISGRPYSTDIQDIGSISGTATAVLGSAVRKRGRTTALTYGFVESISLTINVNYGAPLGVKTFTNQIGLRPDPSHNTMFGDHGDSGSMVVDGSGKIIGLYFAGGTDGHGVANPISEVFSAMNISLFPHIVKSIIADKPLFAEKPIKELIKETKEFKIELKDHGKSEFEKPFDGPLNPGDPGSPVVVGTQPSSSPISNKKVEIKEIQKVEFKEKPEAKENKNEVKEHKIEAKDIKPESKDIKDGKNEAKEHKNEAKEIKHEKIEGKDIKDHAKEAKIEKLENKDISKSEFELPKLAEIPGSGPIEAGAFGAQLKFTPLPKTHKDKAEFKDIKQEYKEVKDFKDHYELQYPFPSIPIPDPALSPGQTFGALSPFISARYRPDLSAGALRQEADLAGKDFSGMSQRLQKEAANAMQAKVNFDNAQPQS